MKMRSHGSRWPAGILLVVLLVLLALPTLRWLTLTQVKMVFAPPRPLLSLLQDLGVRNMAQDVDWTPLPEMRATAERHPDDYGLQLAAVLLAGNGATEQVRNLRSLIAPFPDHPALYAHILRYASMASVRPHRDSEVERYMTGKVSSLSPVSSQAATPEELAAFDRDADRGEKLDPDNAYFPLMCAMGLLAARRDAEALEAVKRAAQKSRWDDYADEEMLARLHLWEQAFGRQTSIARMSIMAATLYPHFASLRALARWTAYKAVQAEAAGHMEEGQAIRHAMMRCGELMRTQSRSVIGSLVGIAIDAIETVRPGGAPPIAQNTRLMLEQSTAQRQEAYYAYLNRIGHPDEARWAQEELAAGSRVRQIVDKGMELSPMGGKMFNNMVGWWLADLLVLTNVLALLSMCLAAALLVRVRRTEGELPPAIMIGVLLVFLGFAWKARWAEDFVMFRMVVANLAAFDSSQGPHSLIGLLLDRLSSSPGIVRLNALAVSLAVPIVTLIVLGILSRTRRQPYASVLVRGLPGGGLVTACALFLLYGGMVLGTAQKEAQMRTAQDRMVQSEGRYCAEITGQTWPEAPPPPTERAAPAR